MLQDRGVRPGAFVGGEAPPLALAVTRAPQKVGQLARIDVLKQLLLVLVAEDLPGRARGLGLWDFEQIPGSCSKRRSQATCNILKRLFLVFAAEELPG